MLSFESGTSHNKTIVNLDHCIFRNIYTYLARRDWFNWDQAELASKTRRSMMSTYDLFSEIGLWRSKTGTSTKICTENTILWWYLHEQGHWILQNDGRKFCCWHINDIEAILCTRGPLLCKRIYCTRKHVWKQRQWTNTHILCTCLKICCVTTNNGWYHFFVKMLRVLSKMVNNII